MGREPPAGGEPREPKASFEDPEQAFQEAIHRHLRRNYLAHLTHGLLGQTGFRLIQAPTFIPSYVHLLSGGSDLAVGVARALQSFGMFLSPLLGATTIEHRRRVLPVGFWVGGLMRVQVLGLALAGFFLTGRPALVAIYLFLTLFGLFMGMQGVIFHVLVAKVIPVERRGRLMGLRNALAGLTAGAVGRLGGELVARDAFGDGYAATFAVAFGLTSLGLASLAFVREPESPQVREPSGIAQRLGELPSLLRRDPEFTRYFLARALATMGRMSMPFYVLYAQTRLPLGGRELGELTLAFVLAQSLPNLAWGVVADRFGFRVVFLASLGIWIAATWWLMGSLGYASLVGVMIGLGAGLGGFMMSSQNLVLEFGGRRNLPVRVAVANSASELVGVAGPLLAGVLSATRGYESVFWTAIGFQVAAVLWVGLFVREPRHRRRGTRTGPGGGAG